VNRFPPCAAVIPCWNEARTIALLVRQVRAQVATVIVVDDGSTDPSAALAADSGAQVVCHPHNQGKGTALRTGLRRAITLGFNWALTLDADGQHPPTAVPSFCERAAQTGAALVVGDRMAQAAAMPWLRRIVNRAMSRQLSRRAGMRLPDSQCGFRLLRLDAWDQLRLETRHFEVESETLLAFIAAGFRVEFVPIPVIPSTRASHIRPLSDTQRWLRWWWGSRPRPPRGSTVAPVPATT